MMMALLAILLMGAVLSAQVPQPFPRPTQQPPAPAPVVKQPPRPAPADPTEPTEATLGLPIYPTAQFLASYDAGAGQRYYIFGTTASFVEMVTYYRTFLKERGDFVFEEPPTHMFEVGRFRAETMVFPPGITIKDYTWNGMKGYPNPKRPAKPERFPTVIMIVPVPPGAAQ
jgi:hypothetical protein